MVLRLQAVLGIDFRASEHTLPKYIHVLVPVLVLYSLFDMDILVESWRAMILTLQARAI